MTTATTMNDPQIMNYLARLDAALGTLPHSEAEEISREIESHIAESLAEARDDGAVSRVLNSLGNPEALARGFATELALTRASHSFSPWLLMRATWRWAMTGAKGVVALILALIGYGTALTMTMSLFMKAVSPARVGLWMGQRTFQLGTPSHVGERELLGSSYAPVITMLAFVTAFGTTQALRWMMRKHNRRTLQSFGTS